MRRREARAAALRALYAIDVGKNELESALRAAFAEERMDSEGAAFARLLAEGVLEHQGEIDQRIGDLSHDWSLERLAAVDRNTLRLGAYELLYRQDEAPVGVVINEAVELAKSYSTPDSGRFVNGILGALARQLGQGGPETPLPPEGGSQS